MKSSKLVTFITIGFIACFAATGCKKKPVRTTPLLTPAVTPVGGGETEGQPIGKGLAGEGPESVKPTAPKVGEDGYPAAEGSWQGRPLDRNKWKNQTVYFDFDRSAVKSGETPKVETVAREFKACPANNDLLIEGHCDERGTPEYNRALGERRAQALREYLIRAGVSASRIHTVSYGKDQPAVVGHDEAAWSKNRRGEFILVLPK